MTRITSFLAALIFSTATPLLAQNSPVVVELFTSQGCSSCPAADAMLHELAPREDVIALALHVDYWDYIGWKDPFADPGHAERQRAYAALAGRRSVYTPEMLVNGVTDIVGAKPMAMSKAILNHGRQPATIDLVLSREGESLRINATALKRGQGPMTVYMLRYTPERTTEIKRGENAGRTLSYANVTEGWQDIGVWDGEAPLAITSPIKGDKPVVVILQHQRIGPIIAAARLR